MLRAHRLSSKLGGILSRKYANVAASPVVVTKSKTGVAVISVEDNTPASSVALVVKAGPRAETTDSAGAAHFLKNFAFKNTSARTAFRTTREAELLGGVLSANLTRESLIISAEFLREDLPYFMELLSDIIFKTSYHQHEFSDVKKKVLFERNAMKVFPDVVALDTAHSVAFRHGLGNSLFANDSTKVKSSQDVSEFASRVYTAPNITIVGTSVDHQELLNTTDKLFQNIDHSVPPTPIASKYYGGEARIAADGISHYVLAFAGAPAGTLDYATLQVLRSLIDGEKHTKWGEGVNALAQVVNKFEGTQGTAFNVGYSDAGLFGVYVSGIATSVYQVLRAAVEELKHASAGVPKEKFEQALAKARNNVAASYETRSSKTEIFGSQVLLTGKVISPAEAVAQFDRVKIEDVKNAAIKVLQCKPTAIAVGDINSLPYSDALSL
ncbi:5206_t:CDS:2 [Acaulospora morrowiae]|uniref:Cytochrome b-c1 complex subunit 2, mitochondrial n=1 Tax=Acaulospora morrowiae TaxID=94023 RepID=A0A9N9FEU5_9GLOM|nr:5206_t:CDS:2 [Acaulospora morrowiae]